MIRPIFFVLAFAAYSAYALQCHQVTAGNLSIPDTSQRQVTQELSISSTHHCFSGMYGWSSHLPQSRRLLPWNLHQAICNSAPQTGLITAFGITTALVSLVKFMA
ncbi:Protein CBG09733 [Caenorhabditis briggsae]|uniref:Protein CBG09733 n=1 Tax=Caenorhabditis briggsae TaxID=6238 RepID=A8X8E1_CAEBR|nr:Protein CBG09733 [Caenorhabditis briggsae]CAP28902.2 Protein CBG09733 [Caenorhabditis briggsae]